MNILVCHIIILGEKRHPYNKCCQCYKYCRNGLMFWKYLCICYEQLVTKYMIYDINFVIYSWLYTPNKSFCSRKWDTFQHMKGDNFHKYCQYCLKIGQHLWIHILNIVWKFQVNISVTFFLMNILVCHITCWIKKWRASWILAPSNGFFVTRQNIFFVIFE